jgi:uncharacterized protein
MESFITQTKAWVETVVIGLNLCPFAQHVSKKGGIEYTVMPNIGNTHPAQIKAAVLEAFEQQVQRLDTVSSIDTILLIVSEGLSDFQTYLDVLYAAEDWLEDHDYAGVYQVASFHPDYQFAGEDPADPSNYTNRSPYPMLHVLREAQITEALTFYTGDPEEIPERNMALTRQMGLAQMQALRAACMKG